MKDSGKMKGSGESGTEYPSASRRASALRVAGPSKRANARKKVKTNPTDGPDKDGFIETRIQTGRSSRANTQPAVGSTKDSRRPQPRKKAKTDLPDGPDKDGNIQTRIQPERSARTNTQTAATEPPPKKALPPKAPNEVMREWSRNSRTEASITNGDLFRLGEAEYINDTLIEFGLKYHWSDLDEDAAASGGKR